MWVEASTFEETNSAKDGAPLIIKRSRKSPPGLISQSVIIFGPLRAAEQFPRLRTQDCEYCGPLLCAAARDGESSGTDFSCVPRFILARGAQCVGVTEAQRSAQARAPAVHGLWKGKSGLWIEKAYRENSLTRHGTGQSVGVLPLALTPLRFAQGRSGSVRMTGFEGFKSP